MSRKSQAASPEEESQTESLSQTSPLMLTDYNGADHRGYPKIQFDATTLPGDLGESVEAQINWCLEAVNSGDHYPNLVLWLRTSSQDLILGHHPAENHERAGHIRAATFVRSNREAIELSSSTEVDCGLITFVDAINVIYDFVVQSAYFSGVSILLSDVDPVTTTTESEHPIFDINEDHVNWGRYQFKSQAFPLPSSDDHIGVKYEDVIDHCDYFA